jgi:peptidoglycan/xylan/chitin deacetylase (PgdA/CDA1 family)
VSTASGGAFVISLDFELHWGVRDYTPVHRYRENLLGVREAIPALLDLFNDRGIGCTWATVGMLMAETKAELLRMLPERQPRYRNDRASPYGRALDEVGENEADDPFHFAPSLVRKILATPRQELATHTFSHYYALEAGQTTDDFDADLGAARRIAEKYGAEPRSIVFPRNQFHAPYLAVLRKHGIRAYRSNLRHWAYRARADETSTRRAFRLADAYAPLSGPRATDWPHGSDGLVDIRASAFLRPYTARLRHLDRVRLRRIIGEMRHAAERGSVYHLWWHPHNFGRNLKENMKFLGAVFDAFADVRRAHAMESLTMDEVAARVLGAS